MNHPKLSLTGTRTIIENGGVIVAGGSQTSHAVARLEVAWLLESITNKPGSLTTLLGQVKPEALAQAVEQYQTRHGFTVDGKIGEQTFAALTRDLAQQQAKGAAPKHARVTPCNPSGLANWDGSDTPVACTTPLAAYVENPPAATAPANIHASWKAFTSFLSTLGKLSVAAPETVSPPTETPAVKNKPVKLDPYRG